MKKVYFYFVVTDLNGNLISGVDIEISFHRFVEKY